MIDQYLSDKSTFDALMRVWEIIFEEVQKQKLSWKKMEMTDERFQFLLKPKIYERTTQGLLLSFLEWYLFQIWTPWWAYRIWILKDGNGEDLLTALKRRFWATELFRDDTPYVDDYRRNGTPHIVCSLYEIDWVKLPDPIRGNRDTEYAYEDAHVRWNKLCESYKQNK